MMQIQATKRKQVYRKISHVYLKTIPRCLILILVMVQCVPRKIWSFWHSEPLPWIVQRCIDTWCSRSPGWDITVVTRATASFYIDEQVLEECTAENMSHQAFSDVVRVALLFAHGGVWMDASCIVLQPIDQWFPLTDTRLCFWGFYLKRFTSNAEYPVIESWIMVARPQTEFMKYVLHEFKTANIYRKRHPTGSLQIWLKYVRSDGVDLQNIDIPVYLWIHVAIPKVLQKCPRVLPHSARCLFCAEDTAYRLQAHCKWSIPRLMTLLTLPCHATEVKDVLRHCGAVKFNGYHRFFIAHCKYIYPPNAPILELLQTSSFWRHRADLCIFLIIVLVLCCFTFLLR